MFCFCPSFLTLNSAQSTLAKATGSDFLVCNNYDLYYIIFEWRLMCSFSSLPPLAQTSSYATDYGLPVWTDVNFLRLQLIYKKKSPNTNYFYMKICRQLLYFGNKRILLHFLNKKCLKSFVVLLNLAPPPFLLLAPML